MPDVDVQKMPGIVEQKYRWYIPYAKATIRLTEAHARGVPFDVEASEHLSSDCLANIAQAADKLTQIPEFAQLHNQLTNPLAGETGELKTALAKYAVANGVPLQQTEAGTTQRAGRISRADQLPAWSLLQSLKVNKARYRAVGQYRQAASQDGRMHSLVTFSASTGRSTSSTPTLQNIPRDQPFRSLIKARPGYLILSADYVAIELRIAAALAERAISDIRGLLKEGSGDSWFMERIAIGVRARQPLDCPPEPDKFSVDWLRQAIPAVAQRVLRRELQMMASIFSRGLDPHLVTAVDMARRKGRLECGRNPVEWLEAMDMGVVAQLHIAGSNCVEGLAAAVGGPAAQRGRTADQERACVYLPDWTAVPRSH
jgi:hypothetical protein